MDHADLARRLSATTLFSHLSRAQLAALLEQSPRRQAHAGAWLSDSTEGLKDYRGASPRWPATAPGGTRSCGPALRLNHPLFHGRTAA